MYNNQPLLPGIKLVVNSPPSACVCGSAALQWCHMISMLCHVIHISRIGKYPRNGQVVYYLIHE